MSKINRYSCYKLDGMCLDAAGSWCSYAEADKRYRELQGQLDEQKNKYTDQMRYGAEQWLRAETAEAQLADAKQLFADINTNW